MAEQALRPCPFCGSVRLHAISTSAGEDYIAVCCRDCGAEGPAAHYRYDTGSLREYLDDAADEWMRWNERPIEDDLLAACELVETLAAGFPGWWFRSDGTDMSYHDQVCAAIAKARGTTEETE